MQFCWKNGHVPFLIPFWGRGGSLIRKHVVDFLLVITEFFSLAVTAETVRAKIDCKSPFYNGVGHFGRKFQVERDIPHQPFVHG